jgi:outer membrane immunogenic protein
MKKLALLASAAVVSGTSAFAADLPSRKVAPVVPVAPAFTWTGFYAGVNAGVDWSTRNIETIVTASGQSLVTNTAALTPAPYGNSRVGFIGGAQIGYNYQINQFVIGAEADFMGMAVNKRSTLPVSSLATNIPISGGVVLPLTVGLNGSTKVSQDWLGTVRLRAGYAIERTLIYITGGLAYGNADVSAQASATAAFLGLPVFNGNWNGSNNSTSVGFAVGAGAEYAITNNWVLRVEYLYYNLGSATVVTNGNSSSLFNPAGPSPIAISQKTTIDGNIVRFAINYKI